MTKSIYLSFINELEGRLNTHSQLIQVLLGPRQVGKTTTILKLIEERYHNRALYVSADQVFNADAHWLTEQWMQAQSDKKILFIDEIQKAYNWASVIKSLYDQSKRSGKPISCVLLGSSSLEIQKGLSESLTGRFQLLRAHHWNYAESYAGYGITFEEYLRFGGYPGSYQFIRSSEWADYVRNSIVGTVVEKDILQYQTVKNPALFRQAFDILISYPAQEISYTKLLGQLQDRGNVEVVKYYLSLYSGAYLIKALEKFSDKAVLRRSSSPKILPLAPCLPYLQVLAPYNPEDIGRILELIVGAQLVRTGKDLYYWREGQHEVDYVLKRGRQLWAIEVKSGRKRGRKGLEQFKKRFPYANQIFITQENYAEFETDPLRFLENHSL
jgi:uncharacterized protein